MEQDKVSMNDTGIVDAKNFKVADRGTDPLEKEERAAAIKNAKEAPKGEFICTTTIHGDKRVFKRGDVYEGKLYPDLLEVKALVPKSEWNKPQ